MIPYYHLNPYSINDHNRDKILEKYKKYNSSTRNKHSKQFKYVNQ